MCKKSKGGNQSSTCLINHAVGLKDRGEVKPSYGKLLLVDVGTISGQKRQTCKELDRKDEGKHSTRMLALVKIALAYDG
jgi:hypothetical protein